MDPRVKDLFDRLSGHGAIDWRKRQLEIIALKGEPISEADHVALIELHEALMDLVEHSGGLGGEGLDRFRGARKGQYLLFLNQEALIDQNIDPTALGRVVEREVAAGRLAADDDFAVLAGAGARVLGERPEPGNGLFRWISNLFGR